MKLNNLKLSNSLPSGKHADGGGLYLEVTAAGGRYWRLKYRFAGKEKRLALGVYPIVGLKQARDKREAAKKLLDQGLDPAQARKAEKARATVEAGNTFNAVYDEWHALSAKRWATTTAVKCRMQFKRYVLPTLGPRPITTITAPELLQVLRKAEKAAPYTASRLREQLGSIWRYSGATGRTTYNPAADLVRLVVAPKVKHRAALTTPREFGEFLQDLKSQRGPDPLTLLATRLALLTFVRSQELRFALWTEVDFEAREWRIPAERMKAGKALNQAHVVPLSAAAIKVLKDIQPHTGHSERIFSGGYKEGGVISENTIGQLLIRMGYGGRQTLHGFRASARSILSERGWSIAALERQLDHAERSKVVAAYARSEHLDERRRLMDDWSAVVLALENGQALPSGANVIAMRAT